MSRVTSTWALLFVGPDPTSLSAARVPVIPGALKHVLEAVGPRHVAASIVRELDEADRLAGALVVGVGLVPVVVGQVRRQVAAQVVLCGHGGWAWPVGGVVRHHSGLHVVRPLGVLHDLVMRVQLERRVEPGDRLHDRGDPAWQAHVPGGRLIDRAGRALVQVHAHAESPLGRCRGAAHHERHVRRVDDREAVRRQVRPHRRDGRRRGQEELPDLRFAHSLPGRVHRDVVEQERVSRLERHNGGHPRARAGRSDHVGKALGDERAHGAAQLDPRRRGPSR